jgi:ADP-ribose pyrophosphatase YjhB (NUDIX family)
VVVDDDRLLLLRRAASRHAWSLPGGPLLVRELLAEAVVRSVGEQAGVEAICGELLGPSEAVELDAAHEVTLAYRVTLLEAEEPVSGPEVVEARWVPLEVVGDLPLEQGLAELLHDHEIIATFA